MNLSRCEWCDVLCVCCDCILWNNAATIERISIFNFFFYFFVYTYFVLLYICYLISYLANTAAMTFIDMNISCRHTTNKTKSNNKKTKMDGPIQLTVVYIIQIEIINSHLNSCQRFAERSGRKKQQLNDWQNQKRGASEKARINVDECTTNRIYDELSAEQFFFCFFVLSFVFML